MKKNQVEVLLREDGSNEEEIWMLCPPFRPYSSLLKGDE